MKLPTGEGTMSKSIVARLITRRRITIVSVSG
jgi:hypothetical protein